MDLTKLPDIPTILFVLYAIFVNIFALIENPFYYVWLIAVSCLCIGAYLITGVDKIQYLYIILSILYTIFLTIILFKYSSSTILPSVYVLVISIIGCTILFQYKDAILPFLQKMVSSNKPSTDFKSIDIMFIICILVTFIILSLVYKFQYIFTSILFLSLFLVIVRYVNRNDTSATTNNIFYTYNTLYLFLFLVILVFIHRIKKFHIPNVTNLLIYGIICSIIFGLKHFIFNNIVPPHIFLYFIFVIIIGVIYISFANSFIPYSNKDIILYSLFTILCILFSFIFGSISNYIPFVIFIISLIVTTIFSISKYSINVYTLIYLSILGLLYFIIHGLNQIEFGNNPNENPMWTYLIICCMIFYLYFFISHQITNNHFRDNQSNIIPFLCTLITYIGASSVILLFTTSTEADYSKDGYPNYSWLLFWIFITILLSLYYVFNQLVYKKDNIIIILCIIYYFIGLIPFILVNKLPYMIIILVYILIMVFLWFMIYYWNKFSNTKEYDSQTNIYYLTGIILFIFVLGSIYWLYSEFPTIDNYKPGVSSMFYWVTLLFLGSMLIYYIYTIFTKTTVHTKIYSIILILIIAYIIFKLFKTNMSHNPNTISGLIFNIVEYIPCLYDQIFSILLQLPSAISNSGTTSSNVISLYIIVFIVVCILLYKYGYKYLKNKLYTSGHTLIDNKAIPLDQPFLVITYDNLQALKFNQYQFGISFKLYINPIPATNTDFTLLTFSKYIYIQYNPYLNHITLWRTPQDLAEPVLIYRQTNVTLQTWINYEINFINDICDVFVNDILATSTNNITLYNENTTTDVVVGTNNDGVSLIQGTIKNLVLYNYPLNMFQISMIK